MDLLAIHSHQVCSQLPLLLWFYLFTLPPRVLLLLEALILRVLICFLQEVCDLQLHQNLSSPQKSNHLYQSNFNQNIY